MPSDRMGEPGQGLENAGHKVLTYHDLVALDRNPDVRAAERSLDIHLTGNMERFMWSFDGVKMSDYHEPIRSEEHTSELQSLMRISYAVFCLKKNNITQHYNSHTSL